MVFIKCLNKSISATCLYGLYGNYVTSVSLVNCHKAIALYQEMASDSKLVISSK